mmetsp:Transcript_21650/g.50610  ORF Transcript_21650/g.50610 Transcript_21650/m.50610 type:complete len:1393 (+) Transcript_21650:132-4310(+)
MPGTPRSSGYGSSEPLAMPRPASSSQQVANSARRAAALDGTAEKTQRSRAVKSASPRPVPHRPVDTVMLAREEVRRSPSPPKAPRLIRSKAAGGTVHEGFYDFAAAVVKPQPSQRQHALRLTELLEDGLRELAARSIESRAEPLHPAAERGSSPSEETAQRDTTTQPLPALTNGELAPDDTAKPQIETSSQQLALLGTSDNPPAQTPTALLPAGESDEQAPLDRLADARRFQDMIALCLDIVAEFGCELTTECRERSALMEKAKAASAEAVQALIKLLGSCQEDFATHRDGHHQLKNSMLQLEDDNTGLRSVVKKMLSAEDEFQAQVDLARTELTTQRRDLAEARDRAEQLQEELTETTRQLTALRAERESVVLRDGSNSPMMCFTTFCMAPENSMPPPTVAELADNPDWASAPMASIGGGSRHISHQSHAPRRIAALPALFGAHSHPHTPCATDEPEPEESQPTPSYPSAGPGSTRQTRRPSIAPKPLALTIGELGQAPSSEALVPAADNRSLDSLPNSRGSSKQTSAGNGDELVPVGQQLSREGGETFALLRSFPALVPYLETPAQDSDKERHGHGHNGTASHVNQEHLEKHMLLLQQDYQQAVDQNKAAQQAVDRCLDRVMVWTLAVHNSLQNLSTGIVAQDVAALAELQQALEWMAKQPLEKWIESPSTWSEALDGYEKRLREHLQKERQTDGEVDQLKRALAQQRQRVVELSDQLLEARASLSSTSRARLHATSNGQCSSAASEAPKHKMRHVGVQCVMAALAGDEQTASETPAQEVFSSSPGLRTDVDSASRATDVASAEGQQRFSVATTARHSSAAEDHHRSSSVQKRSPLQATMSQSQDDHHQVDQSGASIMAGSSASPGESTGFQEKSDIPAASEFEVETEVGEGATSPAEVVMGPSVVDTADLEVRKMRLLRSPFVEGIDFTVVPSGAPVFLKVPEAAPGDGTQEKEDTVLGRKQLHTLMQDIYAAKKASDKRCDGNRKPRRPFHEVLAEVMKRLHGVRSVVQQKSWQLIESLILYVSSDRAVSHFCDFLDGTRDVHELSFYLYCSTLLTTVIVDPLGETAPVLPENCISCDRAYAMVALLFEELPKALGVVKAEMEKHIVRVDAQASYGAALGGKHSCSYISTHDLLEVMLEGWRMQALLLDQSVPMFTWRNCILVFMQADGRPRGWLDPHELHDAEANGLQCSMAELHSNPFPARTSLGAFALREVHRCSQRAQTKDSPDAAAGGAQAASSKAKKKGRAGSDVKKACLEVSQSAFRSLEESLGVYLKWLMHSEELRDLSVYRSLKAQIYGFHKATGGDQTMQAAHHLRCLLLLLLAHQFDTQVFKDDIAPEHLEWETKCLLSILREGWRWQGEPQAEVLSCPQEAAADLSSEAPATFITA